MAKEKLIKDNPLEIPYGRAVSVGNFKLWRGKYNLGRGKDKNEIECVHVSNLDGSWMVRIPSTSSMFSTILQGYATVDESLRNNYLGMILTNVFNVSTISSVALHDAFNFLVEMMTFPYMLLPEKEMVKRMKAGLKADGMDKKKADAHIEEMLGYRYKLYELIERKKNDYIEEYERQQAEIRAREPEELKAMEQDAIAEEALDILSQEGGEA